MKISHIMTALNEEENISTAINITLRAFDDFNIDGEIIVINDGSTDGTKELVNSIIDKDKRVRMTSHHSPQGVGTSFWDGVDIAKGDIVTWLPADNENDPSEIIRYAQFLEHVDIVIPFIYNKWVRARFRNTLSILYRFIINTTFGVAINYTNGTVLYRKSILSNLKHRSRGFFFQTDILIRLIKRGYLFAEVPYRLGMRNFGGSKALSLSSLLEVIRGYLRLIWDIYFTSETKLRKREFSEDSLSAKRYKFFKEG